MPPTAPTPAPVKAAASAQWRGGEAFLTHGASGHAVLMDSDRATNAAPGPMEMVLRSLCACSATDIVIVLRKTRQDWSGVEVSAEGERAPDPPTVYTRVHMNYRIRGARVDRAVAERAVKLSQEKYCSVLATLRHTASITHTLIVEPAP
ncbi:MAG: OsmC family protein [Terriglobales bacterium]